MLNTATLTPILGTDKSNPAFSVYSPTKSKNFYEVYFGLALLEKVNGNTEGIQFKYHIGRLYNAGITRKKLVEALGISLSTIRRYGEAVKSDDQEDMMRRFSGQGAEKKLTPEIENYVRDAFRELYKDDKYTYSSTIINKVKRYSEFLCHRKPSDMFSMNIEQSAGLDFRALDFLLGSNSISSTGYQRRLLKSLAAEKTNIINLFRANAAFIGMERGENVFYYDLHGVKYAGMKRRSKDPL